MKIAAANSAVAPSAGATSSRGAGSAAAAGSANSAPSASQAAAARAVLERAARETQQRRRTAERDHAERHVQRLPVGQRVKARGRDQLPLEHELRHGVLVWYQVAGIPSSRSAAITAQRASAPRAVAADSDKSPRTARPAVP